MISKRFFGVAIVAAVVLISGNLHPAPAAETITLKALLASSARPPFDALVKVFEQKHPGVKIQAEYLGGGVVANRVDAGEAVDIILAGDSPLKKVVNITDPFTPVYKTIDVIVTPKKNPGNVHDIRDLGKPGLKIALGTPSSAVGTISSQIIQKASVDNGGFEFVQKVLKNTNYQSEKGQDVVDAVSSGKSEAAIVFVTDGDTHKFNVIEIPEKYNVVSTYVATVAKAAKNAKLGREFVALMAGKEGQSVFRKMRYLPPA
jgi:ABC-type molybdate transport system substrate-binding protein